MSKTILIAGASTGIGAETAAYLAPGNKIYLHYDRSIQAAEQAAEKVKSSGGKATLLQADLSNEEGCRQLCDELAKTTDKLDVLVNNAGGLKKNRE
jgi:3-oxoacyl-[acyl-carrier protein] reductase